MVGELRHRERTWRTPAGNQGQAVVALACAAQFMVILDVSVVNVALPSIQAALGFDPVTLQWVVNAYALTFAGLLLLGGRFADLYGSTRMLLTGLVLFSTSSLIGGLASEAGLLIAARAVQGVGAAVLAPVTLTMLTTTFPEGHRRTRALAAWTAVGLAGGTAGNLLGGVLTEALSWRWILLINVPIGALAIVIAARLPTADHRRGRRRRLDLAGAALAIAGSSSLTYGITQTEARGWDDPVTIAAAAAGIAALVAFVVVEGRFADAPLMPLRLFRARTVSIGNVVMALAGACLMPMWFFLSLFMQNVLGYGALRTGAGFLPHTLVTTIVGWRITPRLMKRLDDRALVIAGALIAAAGFLWQSRITPAADYITGVLGPGVVVSVGGGLLITPLTATVTARVRTSDAGAASGLMNTAKQLGGALGLAVLVAIAAGGPHTPGALAGAYGRAFLAMAAILMATAAAAFTLPARRDTA